jgi:hypothetical protein
MSVEEVLSRVDGSKEVEEGATLATAGKPKEQVQLADFFIDNQDYKVSFYFASDKLVQVSLSPQDSLTTEAALVRFDSVKKLLRKKYGMESFFDQENRSSFMSREAIWYHDETKITLFVFGLRRDPSGILKHEAAFKIVYQILSPTVAGKL